MAGFFSENKCLRKACWQTLIHTQMAVFCAACPLAESCCFSVWIDVDWILTTTVAVSRPREPQLRNRANQASTVILQMSEHTHTHTHTHTRLPSVSLCQCGCQEAKIKPSFCKHFLSWGYHITHNKHTTVNVYVWFTLCKNAVCTSKLLNT